MLMHRTLLAVVAAGSALLALEDPIYIESGAVRGRGKDLKVYRGIPYAAPPVGALRWQQTMPPQKWIDVRDAVTPGPMCAQVRRSASQGDTNNEDCLKLNVWTPARQSIDGLPVMVWIHGGGFVFGDSNIELMDGTELARQGVVVVTFNYRLGVFGFLSHPELTTEMCADGSGNYGLMDQIAALRWVQRNIRHFGGNPNNVTVFGESAGASSIAYLMVSPHARGLFQRAITQRPRRLFAKIRGSRYSFYGLEPAEMQGARMGRIASLRTASTEEVLKIADTSLDFVMRRGGSEFWPVVDNVVLPHDPAWLFEDGRFHPVPLMIGVTSDEGAGFTQSLDSDDLGEYLKAHYGRLAGRLKPLFPAETPAQTRRSITDAFADAEFYHGARSLALSVSARNIPVYVYRFSREAPHGSETPYVFGSLRSRNAADAELSETMMAMWVRFARTGDPNGRSLPSWPRYDRGRDEHLEFGPETKIGHRIRANTLSTWAEVFRAMR
jgi:para-nitrobenzyl esterase